MTRLLGLAGWSGSGKTTLMVALVGELTARGHRVSTVKHAHHTFDVDQPGKDSYRHRAAGAAEVVVGSDRRWALMAELRGAPEPTLDELVTRMTPVDLVLVEGFKHLPHDKIEVHRPAQAQPLLASDDRNVIAVACDGAPAIVPTVPLLDLNDAAAIADFVVDHCGLAAAQRRHG